MEPQAVTTNLILRLKEVERLVGLSKTTIYSEIAKGRFPKPIQLTKASVGWVASEIYFWIAERSRERDLKAEAALSPADRLAATVKRLEGENAAG